ncbi:hypothetical protein ACFEMC_10375 [Kineococcus sp. DHX-1]|uniref:hypothetical protein n=1 Tax=Kineococcus sp. DHX-1 TaxID=3349638 RepID=UPI0036D31C42
MTQHPRDRHPIFGFGQEHADRHTADRSDPEREDLLELQDRLQSALHAELSAGRIDEPGLHAGTRHQLHRRIQHRRRTRAAVGALALAAVAAVPLGLRWTAQPSVRTVPAASLAPTPTQTSAQTPAQTPAPTPASTSTPSASPPSTTTTSSTTSITPSIGSTAGSSVGLANPNVPVAYDIPDMTRTRASLPAGLTVLSDGGQYPKSPTVMGQECSSRPFDPPMVAGRQITWWNGSQRSSTQSQVDLVVTGRAAGGGPVAFDALVANTGVCRFTDPTTPFALTVAGADQTWAARTDSNGLPFISGAARLGDLIVGITVLHPSADQAAQVSDLTTLLTAAVADLRASGLPAADGR